MADLLDSLDRLDQQRADLHTYSSRILFARWLAPETAKRFQKRLHERFEVASMQRQQVYGLIQADPVLRDALQQREKDRREQARDRSAHSPLNRKRKDRSR